MNSEALGMIETKGLVGSDAESLTPGTDMITGRPSARRVLFARAY